MLQKPGTTTQIPGSVLKPLSNTNTLFSSQIFETYPKNVVLCNAITDKVSKLVQMRKHVPTPVIAAIPPNNYRTEPNRAAIKQILFLTPAINRSYIK